MNTPTQAGSGRFSWLNSKVAAVLIPVGVSLVTWSLNYVLVERRQMQRLEPLATEQARESKASAERAEYDLKQARKPAVQITPRIRQSQSFQDIREIYLDLLLENKGGSDAIVRRIEVATYNGKPDAEAAETIRSTQRFFYEREHYAQPEYRPDIFSAASTGDGANLSVNSASAPPDQVIMSGQTRQAADFRESESAANDFFGALPPHYPCPHGRLIALSADSPDIQWEAVQKAQQVLSAELVMRPNQSASHGFNFLLTEYPLQHDRQWLRFRVSITYDGGETSKAPEKQVYELLVPGLVKASGSSPVQTSYGGSLTEQQGGDIEWQPSAPLIPITPAE